jgi:hypothetical protein
MLCDAEISEVPVRMDAIDTESSQPPYSPPQSLGGARCWRHPSAVSASCKQQCKTWQGGQITSDKQHKGISEWYFIVIGALTKGLPVEAPLIIQASSLDFKMVVVMMSAK